jgi:hypothetical protein
VALHQREVALVAVRRLAILIDGRVQTATGGCGSEVHRPRCAAARGFHLEQPLLAATLLREPAQQELRKEVVALGLVAVQPAEVTGQAHLRERAHDRAFASSPSPPAPDFEDSGQGRLL